MTITLKAVGDFILNAFEQTTEDPFEFVYSELKQKKKAARKAA